MVRILAFTIVLFVGLAPAYGQKIKYKDLFILLNAKQFDEAEPFLKKYLEENTDNPNAHLFMAMIYQEKAEGNDILKETDLLQTNLDSAIYFYDLAYKGIDEKEVRKNDEYYQAYNRRDLRTGKFGVTLSDVQFDLEKKLQALKDRKEVATQLLSEFNDTESLYSKTQFLFKDIKIRFNGEMKALLLRSSDTLLADLARVIATFDSTKTSFDDYKFTLKKMGKTKYNQELSLMDIKSFANDGESKTDFYENDLKLWDYKSWSKTTIETIKDQIFPLRDQLVAADIEINKLREKLTKDSVSVKTDAAAIRASKKFDPLKEYDPSPMPLGLFAMKLAELDYLSELVLHKSLKDSANLHFQLNLLESEITELKKLDSISGSLSSRDFNEEAKDYRDFITNAYGTPTVLRSLVKSTKDFSVRELKEKQTEFESIGESLKWIVDEADSIPLFMEVNDSSQFLPLNIVGEKFTAGLAYADSLATGYFYTITPTRQKDVVVRFPVDQESFVRRKKASLKGLTASDENGQVFYVLVYSDKPQEDKYTATLAKIYRTDGLSWSTNLTFLLPPSEVTFKVETGEVTIKTSNAAGESVLVAVDKNGKRIETAK